MDKEEIGEPKLGKAANRREEAAEKMKPPPFGGKKR